MTLAEITIQIDADQEQRENEVRTQVANAYNLAGLIALFIGNSFNGQKNPSIEELYPQLFPTEPSTPGMSDVEYQRMMMYKEQFMDFAEAHNKKHHTQEGEQ